jgi:hypothetical protein
MGLIAMLLVLVLAGGPVSAAALIFDGRSDLLAGSGTGAADSALANQPAPGASEATLAAAVSDDFNTCGLNTALWSFVNPVGDASRTTVGTFTSDAWLSISVPAGSSHDIWIDGNRAPRVMQPVSNTDFEVEVKFETGVTGIYQMEGILVEQDATSFLRLEFYSNGSSTKLLAAAFSPGSGDLMQVQVLADKVIAGQAVAPLYLRVKRQGPQWTLSYSFDGTEWQSGVVFSHAMTVTSVGTYIANAGPNPPAFTGNIDYFFNTASPISPEDGDRNTLAVNSTGNGQVNYAPVKSSYTCFEPVTLEAIPDPHWEFTGWSGDLSGTTNPVVIAMTGSRSITAAFDPVAVSLALTIKGSGTVLQAPEPPYYHGDEVTLTPVADPGWIFYRWQGLDGADVVDNGDGTWSLSMDGDKEVTAKFLQGDVALTIQPTIGQGTVDPPEGTHIYNYGALVVLSAAPAQGWRFSQWLGPNAGDLVDNGDGTWSLAMDSNKTVQASFVQEQYYVSVSYSGQGAVIHLPGNPYTFGQVATLEPVAAQGWQFAGWQGPDAGDLVDNGDGTWSLVVDGNKNVEATFTDVFLLNLSILGDGTVTHTPGNPYAYLGVATLEPIAAEGWRFKGWYGPNAGDVVDNGDGTWSVTLDADKEIAAKFIERRYNVTVTIEGLGAVAKTPEPPYSLGDIVLLEPMAQLTWTFVGWSGRDAGELVDEGDGTWSIVLDANKQVTATFVQSGYDVLVAILGKGKVLKTPAPPYEDGDTVTLEPVPADGWEFSGWTGANAGELVENQDGTWSLLMNGDKVVTASFTQYAYDIAVTVVGQGSVEKTPEPLYLAGDVATLRPIPAPKWRFANWTGPDSGKLVDNGDGTWSVTMYRDRAVTANFQQFEFDVVVTLVGRGVVRKTPEGPYEVGETITLQPLPSAGWQFEAWSGPDLEDLIDNGDGTWSLLVAGNHALTATFSDNYTLVTSVAGDGQVTRSPDKANYDYLDQVVLTPTPAENWQFAGWSGPDVSDLVYNGDGTWSLIMDRNKEVSATFVRKEYTLTVQIVGQGDVDRTPDGPYLPGAEAILEPQPVTGWYFAGWSGFSAGELQENGDGTWSLIMNSNKQLTATFARTEYTLDVGLEGQGTVETSPAGPYYYEQVVILEPLPTLGWSFESWGGPDGDDPVDNRDGTWSLTMDADKAVIANFVERDLILTIEASGGNGSVTPPVGTHTYRYGEVAALSVTPDPGWEFSFWSGSSAAELVDTGDNTWSLLMNGDKSVKANFVRQKYVLTIEQTTGSGTVNPPPGTYEYEFEETVTLTVSPSTGWRFGGWEGPNSSDPVAQGSGVWSLVMDGDKTLRAAFTPIQYKLTILQTIGNGAVSPGVGEHLYDYGTVAMLTVTPDPGWRFDRWAGRNMAEPVDNGDGTWSLTIDGDKELQARFREGEYFLTVENVGRGSVSYSPGPYTYNQKATLRPAPAPGWQFGSWAGPDAGDLIANGDGSWSLTMTDDKSVTAVFISHQIFLPLLRR